MNFLDLFKKPNLIAAHRGDRSQKPENTLSALLLSVGKCDFIEIDVQLTKDLVPVIIHDDTLGRTSNISDIKSFASRAPWRVSDLTYEELQQLDFGSWFDDNYEPILTLEEALSFAKEKHIFLNVEIKDISDTFADELVIEKVIALIQKSRTEHMILLSSFYHSYLPLCKAYDPKIATAALQAFRHPDNLIEYLQILQVDAYHPEESITTLEVVETLREADYFVNVFTVNNPAKQKELFSWGVNAVFTDYLIQQV